MTWCLPCWALLALLVVPFVWGWLVIRRMARAEREARERGRW